MQSNTASSGNIITSRALKQFSFDNIEGFPALLHESSLFIGLNGVILEWQESVNTSRILKGHSTWVTIMTTHGDILCSRSRDNIIIFRNIHSGNILRTLYIAQSLLYGGLEAKCNNGRSLWIDGTFCREWTFPGISYNGVNY